MKEGFRRLGLFLGWLGFGIWTVFFTLLIIPEFAHPIERTVGQWIVGILLWVAGFAASFLVPWGFVRVLVGITEGFKK